MSDHETTRSRANRTRSRLRNMQRCSHGAMRRCSGRTDSNGVNASHWSPLVYSCYWFSWFRSF